MICPRELYDWFLYMLRRGDEKAVEIEKESEPEDDE